MPARRDFRQPLLPHGGFRVRVLLAMVRYHWFIRLRWIMAFAAVGLLILDRLLYPDFTRPLAELAACLVALAAVNVAWTIIGRGLMQEFDGEDAQELPIIRRVTAFANAQMTVDLLILTVILRYSGGVESPMAVFYLFHMLIAALLLKPLNALLQGAWALLWYGILGFGECLGWIAPHYPFLPSTTGVPLHTDWVYVLAGIAVLGAGIFGTLFFTLQISSRLDEQERELHSANEAFQRSQEAVELLQARRSRFMQTAAHQLKSPLTGIEMLAGLIRDNVASTQQVQSIVQRIIRRCEEAIVQVAELLTLERVEQAAPARHRSAHTDVKEIIERVIVRLLDNARSKHLTLKVETAPCQGHRVAVDACDLEDCISNLVDNAIKYTPEGGRIWVTTAADDGTVSVVVKDTGMGIAEDSLDDIFDPFRRGNLALAANIPGSGLGLSIVREVVDLAGGRIKVRSTVGEGSEFTISLPRQRTTDGAAASGPRATSLTEQPTPSTSDTPEEASRCSSGS